MSLIIGIRHAISEARTKLSLVARLTLNLTSRKANRLARVGLAVQPRPPDYAMSGALSCGGIMTANRNRVGQEERAPMMARMDTTP